MKEDENCLVVYNHIKDRVRREKGVMEPAHDVDFLSSILFQYRCFTNLYTKKHRACVLQPRCNRYVSDCYLAPLMTPRSELRMKLST